MWEIADKTKLWVLRPKGPKSQVNENFLRDRRKRGRPGRLQDLRDRRALDRDGFRPPQIMKALSRTFYERGTVQVSRDLLGKVVVHGADRRHHRRNGSLPGRRRSRLPFRHRHHQSHAGDLRSSRPRLRLSFLRNARMPEPRRGAGWQSRMRSYPGTGTNHGLELMRVRRPNARRDRDLTSGPGKLTQALAITRAQNGVDVTRGDLIVLRAESLRSLRNRSFKADRDHKMRRSAPPLHHKRKSIRQPLTPIVEYKRNGRTTLADSPR